MTFFPSWSTFLLFCTIAGVIGLMTVLCVIWKALNDMGAMQISKTATQVYAVTQLPHQPTKKVK